MRIGILTGGGDVPGLNAAIKAVVVRAAEQGHEVLGLRRGWAGLLNVNPDHPESIEEYTQPMDTSWVRTIDRTGGTILHSSRTHPGKVKADDVPDFLEPPEGAEPPYDFTPHAIKVLETLGIDVLIPIGGDDTLKTANKFQRFQEELPADSPRIPVVHLPKTIDNDYMGIDFTFGYFTAVDTLAAEIRNLLYDAEAGFGVRLEDLCYLTCEGLVNLTPLPLDWDPRAWIETAPGPR